MDIKPGLIATMCVLMGSGALSMPSRMVDDSKAFVPAAKPGGIDRKHIGLFFDVMSTTPSNILANADQFATHAPYVDGVAIGLQDVPVIDKDGSIVRLPYHHIMSPTQRWTRDAVKDQLPFLREIVKKPHLQESLLLFWMSPKGGHRIRWDDDKGWANFAENMATVAWLAKEAGMKGLMLDPEEYGAQGGQAAQYIQSYDDPPFPVMVKLARQRGREVFSRIFAEFPDAVIFSLWCFKKFEYWLQNGRQPFPGNYADDAGEVLQYFLNGMLDVLPPEARIVEGCEHYSGSSLNNSYVDDFINEATTVLPMVAPENIVKYRSQCYYGNTHFFDMYAMGANPKSRWYFGPVNGSRLEHLRLNMAQSLRVATKYVWFYAEKSGKLFNWRDGHYEKQKTWEEVVPGLTETIMMVKDPLAFAAKRKAALRKERKLVNLASEFESFTLEGSDAEREFHLSENKMSSAKGLKPGERYYASVWVHERASDGASLRAGAAIPMAFWRKDGKRTAAKPMKMKVHYDWPLIGNKYVIADITVEVPDDADELVFDLGASVRIDERISFLRLQVCNLLDPVVPIKSDRKAKWKYDSVAKTLSDGNWTLNAVVDHKKVMSVRGANEKTIGSGVLDFSSVKEDTGYPVKVLSNFKDHLPLTALIAPDVDRCSNAFSGCSNLVSVAIGNIGVSKSVTNSPSATRVSRLQSIGCRGYIVNQTGFQSMDHRHSIWRHVRPEQNLSVKGVKPGELYAVGLSMKRKGAGWIDINVRFRGNGKIVRPRENYPTIAMSEPRVKENKWRKGEVVVRVPEGADELFIDMLALVAEGHTCMKFDDFEIYKIGEPLPVWPAEALRKKE